MKDNMKDNQQKASETVKLLNLIYSKLDNLEKKVIRQEENIYNYIDRKGLDGEADKLLLAGLSSTRTSFELMKDELDEIHQILMGTLSKTFN